MYESITNVLYKLFMYESKRDLMIIHNTEHTGHTVSVECYFKNMIKQN